MRLIPSIDLRGGRVVRLLHGDFLAETVYADEPAELLDRYQQSGAAWVHLVDLDGARDGDLTHRTLIGSLASRKAPCLQVGGGVRSLIRVQQLLELGVSRVVVGSAAIDNPDEVEQWLSDLGPDRLCLAFDVRLDAQNIPRIHTRGWRESTPIPLWEAVERYLGFGLRHVLCTDIARDGALQGPNLELYSEAVRRYPRIAWQASGGVRQPDDLSRLAAVGVAATISGRALLEAHLGEADIARWRGD